MHILRLHFVTFSLLLTLTLMPRPPVHAGSDTVITASNQIGTGELTMITISLPGMNHPPYVRFAGRKFTCFTTDRKGVYKAMIAAPLSMKPGPAQVAVLSEKTSKPVAVASILVKRKKYPEEHLKVSKKMVNFKPDTLKRVLADQKAVKKACSGETPERYWSAPFIWPVNSRILSPFGLRRFFNEQPRSPHSGTDMRAREGTPIKASNRGRIVLARNCYLSGNTLVIDHGAGLFTLYAHLSKMLVHEGEMVKRGAVIGLAGATGRATGPHLHWGASLGGSRVDPESLMKVAGTSTAPGQP